MARSYWQPGRNSYYHEEPKMQSRKFHLTSLAPIAVALSVALVGPALAQEANNQTSPQLLVSSPLDTVAGSLPKSIFENAENAAVEANMKSAELTQEEAAPASVYSPAHLEIKPIAIATAAANLEPASEANAISNGASAVSTDINSAAPSSETIQQAEVSQTEATDLSPVALDADVQPQLRGAAPTVQTDTSADAPLGPNDVAQSVQSDTVGNTGDTRDFDLTPVSLPRRNPTFNRMEGFQGSFVHALPPKLFFSAFVDNSLRLETNVYQTKNHYRQDMIYRVLPNTVLGWALTRKTRVSANYFFLRDQYTKYANPLDRNFHSVGGQIDHDFYTSNKWQVTGSFFARALFTTPDEFSSQFFNDLLPSVSVLRYAGMNTRIYGTVMGQIRFREVLSRFQEGDQFYSIGAIHNKNRWQFLGDFTLNNNFGNSNLRQGHNNQVIILTEEVAYRLPKMPLPIEPYIRCQQIFNMGANSSPGYAGINTRVFGGIRAWVAKPVIYPVKLAEK